MEQRETEIGSFPDKYLSDSLSVRPDRSGVALIVPGEGNSVRIARLESGGVRLEPEFSEIFPRSMRFSAQGHLNYVACSESGHFNVVEGSVENEAWDAISDEGGWSSGGALVFVGLKGAQNWVVTPHERFLVEGEPWRGSVVINADGSAVAWQTFETKNLNVRKTVWSRGQKWLEPIEILLDPVWSPDGSRLACGYGDDTGAWVRVGEERFGPYTEFLKNTLVWSEDSRVCVWATQRGGKAHLVINGEEMRLDVSTLRAGTLSLSPDGTGFAAIAHVGFLGIKGALITNAGIGQSYIATTVTPPQWTPQGDTVAYCVNLGLVKTAIVCDGRVGATHTAYVDGSLRWNRAGTLVSCLVKHEKRPAIAVESRVGESFLVMPAQGSLFKGEGQFWSGERTLRDVGFRPDDGSIFLLEATF